MPTSVTAVRQIVIRSHVQELAENLFDGAHLAILEHKRHLARPGLSDGDGAIPVFRRWARQFYPSQAGAPGTSDRDPPRA